MNEIASRGQLRMSYIRWALFTVPTIVFLGLLSGRVSNSGYDNEWFAALVKPTFMPPGWAFPVAWTLLYVLLGFALAVIIHARGARWRGAAVVLFLVQLTGNYFWSPLFFRMHQVTEAFWLILLILAVSVLTTWAFARVRTVAALLMLPYLAWLTFAAALNYEVDRLNPDASRVAAPGLRANIE